MFAARRAEGDHGAVADTGYAAIERRAEPEHRRCLHAVRAIAGPTFAHAELRVTERGEHGVIERDRSIELIGAKGDVVNHEGVRAFKERVQQDIASLPSILRD